LGYPQASYQPWPFPPGFEAPQPSNALRPAAPAKKLALLPPLIPDNLSDDTLAATVNGEKILAGDIRKFNREKFRLASMQRASKYPPFPEPIDLRKAYCPPASLRPLVHEYLDVLIDDAVMRHYLNKEVPVAVVQDEFDRRWPSLREKRNKAKEGTNWEAFLQGGGQTEEQLRRDLIAELQRQVLLARHYPDEKLRAYYEAIKPHFDGSRVRASHILIKVKPDATPGNASKPSRNCAAGAKILQGASQLSRTSLGSTPSARPKAWRATSDISHIKAASGRTSQRRRSP
jgi:hypothetical protein